MESHTLWTLNSLLVYIVKCLPVCICMVESGVWSKSCLPLQMHARFPSLRHLKKNKSSPPFWTPSVLPNDKRHRFPPPPPTSPPSSWRQVAALLDFTIGRHSQSGRDGKDFSHPCGHCAWVPFFNTELNIQTILGFASYLHHPHKTLAKQRSQQAQRIQEKKKSSGFAYVCACTDICTFVPVCERARAGGHMLYLWGVCSTFFQARY